MGGEQSPPSFTDYIMTENAYWTEQKTKFNDEDLNVFKTWHGVRSVPLYAEFQFEEPYAQDFAKMFFHLSDEDKVKWRKSIKEPFLGHTEESYKRVKKTFVIGEERFETTPWSVKSNHHALTFESITKNKFNDYEQIVEFGAGIGDTCRVINDIGYTGDYYIYDLPEVLRISTFYNSDSPNVKGATHYSQIPNDKKTLFIGTWSISEVPPAYRDEVFTHFINADYHLIYQNVAFEYDNNEYFTKTFPNLIKRNIQLMDIPWLSHIAGGNLYLNTI